MSDWDKFLEQEPDPKATERVMAAVESELRTYRASRRKILWAWLAPTLAAAVGGVTWVVYRRDQTALSPELMAMMEVSSELASTDVEKDLELLEEDFDLLTDLEVLELWTSS